MGLDFSKLEKLAFRDFGTPEALENREDLLSKGFVIVEDKDNPFIGGGDAAQPLEAQPRPAAAPQEAAPPAEAPKIQRQQPQRPPQQRPDEASEPPQPQPQRPLQRPQRPFKSAAGLDYKAFYGDLYRWHERTAAQVLQSDTAWIEAADTLQALGDRYNAKDNAFVEELLTSVYEEIERNYRAAQQ